MLRVLVPPANVQNRRLVCVNHGFHIAALKTDFAGWSDSHRGSARDGENGLSTSRRTYLRLSPIIEGGIINVLEMSFEVPEPPPRGESYYMNFVFGMIRVEVSDAENKPYVGRPPGRSQRARGRAHKRVRGWKRRWKRGQKQGQKRGQKRRQKRGRKRGRKWGRVRRRQGSLDGFLVQGCWRTSKAVGQTFITRDQYAPALSKLLRVVGQTRTCLIRRQPLPLWRE